MERELLFPPPGFSYIEDSLCRCVLPLNGYLNVPFFKSISLGSIVNVSGELLDEHIQLYTEEYNISLYNIFLDGKDPFKDGVVAAEKLIKSTLQLILSLLLSTCVLVVGSSNHFYDCAIVACLRRVQSWSFACIIGEFRFLTGPHILFDMEQFIENFNPSIIDLGIHLPDFLSIHFDLLDEEKKLFERMNKLKLIENETNLTEEQNILETDLTGPLSDESSATRQRAVDEDLYKLFFPDVQTTHTAGSGWAYDAALSLISDVEEE